MTKAKFTSGEWSIIGVDNSYAVLRKDTGYGICTTTLKENADLANAHLIAAAPEMYKLLVQLQVEGGLGVARHRQIDRALAKARGEHE